MHSLPSDVSSVPLPPSTRPTISTLRFIIYSAFFFATLGNLAFWCAIWNKLPINSLSNIFFMLSMLVLLFAIHLLLFSLLLWRFTAKPLLILLLFLGAAVNYFSLSYGVYIDKYMLMNIAATNLEETYTLITPKLVIWFLLLGILPALWVVYASVDWQLRGWKLFRIRVGALLCALLFFVVGSLPTYKHYAAFFRNDRSVAKLIVPINYIGGGLSYARFVRNQYRPLVRIGEDAKLIKSSSSKNKLLVIVVGETARAKNFSLNGYERQTNPLLQQQPELINFSNVISCGTSTAVSVPCMFSNMERKNYSEDQASYQENLLDILQRAGIQVLWRENNTGCQGVCKRIAKEEILEVHSDLSDCPNGLCRDEFLLEGLQNIMDRQQSDAVIVLHMNGSHGPTYYQRYPKAMQRFNPACETNQIQDCSAEALRNVYDNTIVYTDFVLNQLIELLKQQSQFETAMLYISDHGESLGEKGLYLHSTPYRLAPVEQTHVPMLFWASSKFMKSRSLQESCLRQKGKTAALSQDYLFHSVLGLMSVQTQEYLPSLDLFRDCRS